MVLVLFVIIYTENLILLVRRFLKSKDEKNVVYLFFSLVTLIYGMLEIAYGAGSIAMLLMFFSWGSTFCLDTNAETG